ncbi:MAG TPA: hypothetical protein VHN98_08865 [Acidimicrobiales bacterium]|nr:hypothetical protein [Acidimicrobiales bacterium]
MSDLSNLLGDVYSMADPDGPAVRHEPAAAARPAAPAAEVAPSWTAAPADAVPAGGWTTAADSLSHPMTPPLAVRMWTPGDDDIFPLR